MYEIEKKEFPPKGRKAKAFTKTRWSVWLLHKGRKIVWKGVKCLVEKNSVSRFIYSGTVGISEEEQIQKRLKIGMNIVFLDKIKM